METIDLSKMDCDENLRWAIIELMVNKTNSPNIEKVWPNDDLKYQVEMKIDGVEVKFSALINLLMEQFDDQVKKAAIEFVQDKNNEFNNKMNDLIEDFKYKMLERPSGL